ncbi:putative transposase [Herbaspirillum sp. Sphag1AN]|uniref:DDE-type integrase/transposase/recombinase n=1 Tax=unclassified Herbaspirillum TaxID=2624150 RepID=UPI001615ADE1|nr:MULTISPECIES: DDE-type integrase/transposase/recombinase [unclassified Herbaspirillum]MBB3214410.1 putative transposase [Herbaspirillum sp. Sphag1AN]MBB3247486.1 putative transposase [Herbaspirillum sp. Sphag64]
MLRFKFKKGLRFLQGQKTWTLLRRLPTHKFQLEDEQGVIEQLTHDEIFERWHSRGWAIDESSLNENSSVFYQATPRDLSSFSQKHQDVAKRRFAYLCERAAVEGSSLRLPALESPIVPIPPEQNSESTGPKPHRTTLYRWRIRLSAGKDIVSLVDRRVRAGRKRNAVLYRYFEDALNSVYLTPQKTTKVAVYEEVRRQIDRFNKSQPESARLKAPSRATIFNWLGELDTYLVDVSRLGKPAADRLHRRSIGSAPPCKIMERIEIDHSPIDAMIVDKATMIAIGRPWITLACCRATRAILGFYVTFNAPSSLSVLRCLNQVMLPKTDLRNRYPDIKNDWPMHGIPEEVVCDNGMDLHSRATEELCLHAGIRLTYCLPADPGAKGSVERGFRRMNEDLIHKLPGAVFSNPEQRGDYPSEKEAILDLDDLTYLITKWIVDVYHQTPHRELKERPIDVWNRQVQTALIEYPAHHDSFQIAIGEPAERTLFLYGIEFEGLHYNSDELQNLRRRTGESSKIRFKYFDDDISFIQVWDENKEEYFRVNVSPKHNDYVLRLNRQMHRVIHAHRRRAYHELSQEMDPLHAKQEILDMVSEARVDKKMRQRKRAAVLRGHSSERPLDFPSALDFAEQRSLPSKSNPPEDLDAGLEDELPDYEISI